MCSLRNFSDCSIISHNAPLQSSLSRITPPIWVPFILANLNCAFGSFNKGSLPRNNMPAFVGFLFLIAFMFSNSLVNEIFIFFGIFLCSSLCLRYQLTFFLSISSKLVPSQICSSQQLLALFLANFLISEADNLWAVLPTRLYALDLKNTGFSLLSSTSIIIIFLLPTVSILILG